MSSEHEFFNRIRADLDDPVPRLIYADWLDDQGDPRGEFIRIQCELEQPHLLRGRQRLLRLREKELLKEHRAEWLAPVPAQPANGARFTFRRGFVEEVALETRDFLDLRGILSEGFPLLHKLELRELTRELVEMVAKSPVLEKLTTLRLRRREPHPSRPATAALFRTTLEGPALRGLLSSPHLINFNALDLRRPSPVYAMGLRAVFACDTQRFRSLNLTGHSLDMYTVQIFAGSRSMNELRELSIGRTGLDINQLLVLTYSDHLANLESLALRGNWLCSERNMISLAGLSRFSRLKRLDVRDCGVGDVGVETLVRLPMWPHMETVQLAGNNIGNRGLIAIANGPPLTKMASLDLQYNRIGDAGLTALAESPVLSTISHLHLEHNQITIVGIMDFARTKYGGQLQGLYLRGNRAINGGMSLASGTFPKLETLDLSHTRIGDETAWAIVKSPLAAQLRALDLSGTELREAGAWALAQCEALRSLELLDLRLNHLHGDCVTFLKERFGNRVLV